MKTRRNSKQRQLVLEAVKARRDHPTADQIYLDVRARDDKISRGTVYRNLGLLSDEGQISQVRVPAADRYDLRQDRHYHLFCTGCGRVFDAPHALSCGVRRPGRGGDRLPGQPSPAGL